jgi:hypothetical protein
VLASVIKSTYLTPKILLLALSWALSTLSFLHEHVLFNIEGTCQHWAREKLRTSRDIMEFKPERQLFGMGTIPSDINAPRIEGIMLHNNQLTDTLSAASFATKSAGKHSKLRVLTLNNNNELSGDMNEMCPLNIGIKLEIPRARDMENQWENQCLVD